MSPLFGESRGREGTRRTKVSAITQLAANRLGRPGAAPKRPQPNIGDGLGAGLSDRFLSGHREVESVVNTARRHQVVIQILQGVGSVETLPQKARRSRLLRLRLATRPERQTNPRKALGAQAGMRRLTKRRPDELEEMNLAGSAFAGPRKPFRNQSAAAEALPDILIERHGPLLYVLQSISVDIQKDTAQRKPLSSGHICRSARSRPATRGCCPPVLKRMG